MKRSSVICRARSAPRCSSRLAAPKRAGLNVVTTTSDLASIVSEVGGDKIAVESLARGYQDPHFVEAKPSFVLKLNKADLLVVVGRDLEIGWLPALINQARNARIQPGADGYFDASLTAKILDLPTGQITRAMGDVHPLGNPHYWLDPENGRRIAKAVQAKLSQKDPANAAYYAQRAADFDRRLSEAQQRWKSMMAPYKGIKVVTYHRSWANFADAFGIDVIGYVEPKPGIPPTPQHTLDVIQAMRAQGIKLIIVEPVLRFEDAELDRVADRGQGAGAAAVGRRRAGRRRLSEVVRHQHQPAGRRDQVCRSQVMELSVIVNFLAAPFVASLILTGIHAYLGVHVVERGVIFVDLSLAQIAALGATIALLTPLSGGDPHAPSVYWVSLAFTFIGAGIFSMIRVKRARIPQEAIIGICYAVASAAAILAMSKATSESEHLKDMLVGNILAVTWHEVIKTAVLYGIIGVFHYVFRKQFLAISRSHGDPESTGLNYRLWDFLFYASFGFVVTSSVSIAGVLLVFCYLIVPSVAAMLYSDSIGKRLAIGWTMGTVVSALGVYLSLVLDLPTGATIVCTFGLVLIGMAAVRPLIAPHRLAGTVPEAGGPAMRRRPQE